MADVVKLLSELSELPESLQKLATQSISVQASCSSDSSQSNCPADSSDCTKDGASCTSDGVCTSDGGCSSDGSCTSDGITTKPSISVYEVTSEDVTFKVSGLTSGDVVAFYVIQQDPKVNIEYAETKYTATGSTLRATFDGLQPNKEYAYNFVVNGVVQLSSARYFTTPASSRPNNWSWTSTISSGADIAITATEWNSFCSRINQFRSYKSLSSYSFTTVSRGTTISATIVNQARTAINGISGHGTLPSAATSGGTITASFFNSLASALNSIP